MRDRKFGYHGIWLLPVHWCMRMFDSLCTTTKRMILRTRIQYLENKNPELKRIRKLSGINKHD
jgi:hypothetical protein